MQSPNPSHHDSCLDVKTSRVSLSRSPHPYLRRGDTINQDQPEASAAVASTESTESGTEADDEKTVPLRGLPAPPPRLHKGLRGSTPPKTLTPARTPLPTPPAVVQQELSGYFEAFRKHKEEQDAENRKKTREYVERKKKEITRRVVEVLLLITICGLTAWSTSTASLRPWLHELILAILLPVLLYMAYPVRKSFITYKSGSSVLRAGWLGFHIPSRFDPGPLLYPIVLPVIIAMSVLHARASYLPVNITCAMASIPLRVTAIWNQDELFWYIRWIVTLLPFHSFGEPWMPTVLKLNDSSVSMEDLAGLFPLHQCLKSMLAYLTTTSLDPSELELLTTGFIDILLFARSPQAQVLKAAVWIGGLSIFVTCRQLLAWQVALARIPKWRFAKQAEPYSLLQRLQRAFKAFSSSADGYIESSDDEVDERFRIRPLTRVKTLAVPKHTVYDSADYGVNGPLRQRGRRSTFSAVDGKTDARKSPRSQLRSFQSSSFLALTAQQALVRKYVYAGLTYSIVLTILSGPVWYYVRTRALSGYEPLGWALGYAFGNTPAFRDMVEGLQLSSWIPLPAMTKVTELINILLQPANQRLLICVYCLIVLTMGIIVVLSLTSYVEVDTRRKVFHGVMVAMLLPTIFVDPCFLALALTIILAAFLLLDLFRASQLPPISRPLTIFLAPYTDGRDHRGPVIVSHIFLLIGCAIPLWLSLAGLPRIGVVPWLGWDVPTRDVSMISGVVCVGMGDAAASLIGRRYGRTKWYWAGGKSLEGSFAFAVAVTIGLMFGCLWLRIGGWIEWDFDLPSILLKCVTAGTGASLLESVLTAANDNVVVPIGLWLLVRGLKI